MQGINSPSPSTVHNCCKDNSLLASDFVNYLFLLQTVWIQMTPYNMLGIILQLFDNLIEYLVLYEYFFTCFLRENVFGQQLASLQSFKV